MKKVLAVLAIAGFVACNNNDTKTSTSDTTKVTTVDTTKVDSSKMMIDTTKKDTTKTKM